MGRSRNLMVAEHLAFKNDRHIRNVFEALNEQRQSARYTDTVLKIGLTEIKVHRCVLAAAIPKLLENQDGEEKSLLTMNLEGLDPNAVEVLVEFAYTGELSVSAGEVLSLYHVAKSLGMREVQDSCEQFVREKVLPLDWMAVRGFAEQQDCPSLMIAVDKFIEQHVGEIYHKKDFFQLPRLQIELASTNDRPRESIDSEKLCNVAITWAHKQLEVREYFYSLTCAQYGSDPVWCHVRFCLFTKHMQLYIHVHVQDKKVLAFSSNQSVIFEGPFVESG